ncbi:pyridoxamine 5'-phosphate oxidase family protein [Pseudonocardia phyllosphaerae]|uniref:pyridoxamine 5'-phosphate oxidase family protein n=1 Tax=Pseudonocardia phyllosphaerae TaxID=3390502 RepID=UPI00397D12B8
MLSSDTRYMDPAEPVIANRLRHEDIVWLATVRPDGSPHVTPVWFVFDDGTWWIGCNAGSVKVRNCRDQPMVSLALDDGRRPVVAEGAVRVHTAEFPDAAVALLARKYDGWDITADDGSGPRALIEVRTTRWLLRGDAQ